MTWDSALPTVILTKTLSAGAVQILSVGTVWGWGDRGRGKGRLDIVLSIVTQYCIIIAEHYGIQEEDLTVDSLLCCYPPLTRRLELVGFFYDFSTFKFSFKFSIDLSPTIVFI